MAGQKTLADELTGIIRTLADLLNEHQGGADEAWHRPAREALELLRRSRYGASGTSCTVVQDEDRVCELGTIGCVRPHDRRET